MSFLYISIFFFFPPFTLPHVRQSNVLVVATNCPRLEDRGRVLRQEGVVAVGPPWQWASVYFAATLSSPESPFSLYRCLFISYCTSDLLSYSHFFSHLLSLFSFFSTSKYIYISIFPLIFFSDNVSYFFCLFLFTEKTFLFYLPFYTQSSLFFDLLSFVFSLISTYHLFSFF